MSDIPQYTNRDRIKFACYSYAVDHGLNDEQMVDLFTKAANNIRATEKTAFWGSWRDTEKLLGTGLGIAGASLLAPHLMAATGHTGYIGGQVIRRVAEGRVPTVNEMHLMDETAEYKRAVEEIRRRVLLNRARRQSEQTPSNRRMF